MITEGHANGDTGGDGLFVEEGTWRRRGEEGEERRGDESGEKRGGGALPLLAKTGGSGATIVERKNKGGGEREREGDLSAGHSGTREGEMVGLKEEVKAKKSRMELI